MLKYPDNSIQVKSGDMAYATTVSDSYADVANISGKGLLTGISQNAGHGTGDKIGKIKIIIDGVTIYDGNYTHFNTTDGVGGSMSNAFLLRFKSSLQIQHAIDSVTLVIYTTVSYALN